MNSAESPAHSDTKKLPLSLHITVVLALAILLGLGTWQLQRLEWKTDLIARHQAAMKTDVVPVKSVAEIFPLMQEGFYRKMQVTAGWDFQNALFFPAKVHNGEVGAHLYIPLQLADGTILFARRGWVPLETAAAYKNWLELQKKQAVSDEGDSVITIQTFNGMLVPKFTRGMMRPDNSPKTNEWYWTDLPAMAAASGLDPTKVIPALFLEDGANDVKSSDVSPPWLTRLESDGCCANLDRNAHLEYALTWYSLAIVLLVIYFALWRQKSWKAPQQ